MQNQKIIMWFGYTQTAKSSSIKLLTGDQTIQCGKPGRGGSTTSEIKIYKEILPKLTQKYLHLDSIGLGDNTLKYNEQSIREHIEKAILNLSSANNFNKISAIIITQSLKDSSHQLRNIFAQITKIFGFLPVNSIIVLGTKQNAISIRQQVDQRQQQLKSILIQFCVPEKHYMRFDTPYINFSQSSINPFQYTILQQKLSSCHQFNLQSIKQKYQAIITRAGTIQSQRTRIQDIEVQQDKVLYKDQERPYTVQVVKDRWKKGWGKVLGVKESYTVDETRYMTVSVPYIVKEKVIKQVQRAPEFDYCYHIALEEFKNKAVNQMVVSN